MKVGSLLWLAAELWLLASESIAALEDFIVEDDIDLCLYCVEVEIYFSSGRIVELKGWHLRYYAVKHCTCFMVAT